MTAKELYLELRQSKYDNRPYDRLTGMGNRMEIVEEVIDDYWRERFLINHADKTAYELMDRSLRLTFLSEKDVDWKSVEPLENNSNAYSFFSLLSAFCCREVQRWYSHCKMDVVP